MNTNKNQEENYCEYCKPKSHLKRWIIIGCLFIFIVIIFAITNQGFPNFFEDKKESSESTSLQNQYDGWKECRNFGLNLSLRVPSNWECNSNEVVHNIGDVIITGDKFQIEIENIGRSFGCMVDNTCTDVQIYDRDIISLHLVSFSGIDSYMFGIFKDNLENRSYGGILVKYEGIGERKMTPNEEIILFKVLDSLTHNF